MTPMTLSTVVVHFQNWQNAVSTPSVLSAKQVVCLAINNKFCVLIAKNRAFLGKKNGDFGEKILIFFSKFKKNILILEN